MDQKNILILWDASHIWGLMAFRAMRSLGLPCRLVKALEIAQGGFLGKRAAPDRSLLLVPGGNARQKARALGPKGLKAIRDWVANGGLYLGFCGGAGLALDYGDASLGICPIKRAKFEKRFYHFLSGHVKARLADSSMLCLPIWWPGRFDRQNPSSFSVLARYEAPAPDLWLADLPLAAVPKKLLSAWAQSRDLDSDLGFPANEALVIQGHYGKGGYILSYAHLETPASPQANRWLAHLLEEFGGISSDKAELPPWHTLQPFPMSGSNGGFAKIAQTAHKKMLHLCSTGLDLGLLFKRQDWLLGWRSGFSGIPCNNLLASLAFIREFNLASHSRKLAGQFEELFELFIQKADDWLWMWRLDSALAASRPSDGRLLNSQIDIFGHPMLGGGLLERLLDLLDDHIWHSCRDD